MTRDPRYDILFEPVQIGPRTLKNRFFQTAHCMSGGTTRPGMQAHLRGMKAEGGWAAVTTEACAVSPEADDSPGIIATLWDEGDVKNLALMAQKVQEHGALAGVELWHGGPTARNLESRMPAVGVSSTYFAFDGVATTSDQMSKREIRAVQKAYVRAAKLAVSAGFDIITLSMVAASDLPHMFILPMFNLRTDEYGGSFANRARFARELLELLRDTIGDQAALSCRFGIDTLDEPQGYGDRGVRVDGDGGEFMGLVDEHVDFWDIITCGLEWGENAAPSRSHPTNWEAPWSGQAKQYTDKPVVNVGRFTDPDLMVEIIRSGQCDIIGAARPSIADPFLPSKVAQGRFEDIRECIGCNVCVSRFNIGGPPIICTQNATMGEEFRRGWHPEKFTRAANADNDVLVLGAGPAGMECAMVLAKRGMRRVHLVDAGPEIGGSMRWISQLPGLSEWARVTSYRKTQLEKLKNVEVITSTLLTAEQAREYGAEIIVVATGSTWNGTGLNGFTMGPIAGADAELTHVLTPTQVMDGKPVGERVAVYDVDGYFAAVGIAEKLAREGHDVTLVSAYEGYAPYTKVTLEHPRIGRTLVSLGVEILASHLVVGVEAGRATVVEATSGAERELAVDSVVLVTQRDADSALYHELRDDDALLAASGVDAVFRIGDCVAPNIPAQAIFSGHRLAREIDSADPDTWKPYIRERRIVDSEESDFRLDGRAIVVPPL